MSETLRIWIEVAFNVAYLVAIWSQVAKLTASDAQADDDFGCSVSISNDTVVVEAYGEDGLGFLPEDRGAAYVFERNQGGIADNWGQVTRLRASDAANNDYLGCALAISGDQVIVGAYGENGGGSDRGAVRHYRQERFTCRKE